MYIQVRQPLGALVTIKGSSYKIPFIVHITEKEKKLFEEELNKIKADYTITGGRKFSPAKPPTIKKSSNDNKTGEQVDENKTKKSNRKSS